MKNRKLKKGVFYGLYTVGITLFFVGLSFLDFKGLKNEEPKADVKDVKFVDDIIIDDAKPVVDDELTINRPYLDQNVVISKGYYEFDSSEEEQKQAIIFYENTYMPSTGIFYVAPEKFEATAILPGEVTSISNDSVLGTVVLVTHENGIVSSYESLSEVNVNKGDKVIQGQVIGISGPSNLNKDEENNLYFELIINGINVNPEKYYNKHINEIES